VFLALREENSVMKHFYPAASNVGELNFFWRTLDSVSFTDYTFSKLVEYPLVSSVDSRKYVALQWSA